MYKYKPNKSYYYHIYLVCAVKICQMENEVRRLVTLVEQHEQQITTVNADHSRRLQEERTRWESK